MPRLRVGIVRFNNVVLAQVLEQDEALRGGGGIHGSGEYGVYSSECPTIGAFSLSVRGTEREDDCITVCRPFPTEAEAKDWVRNITALIHEINHEPAQAKPDDGSVQVIVAE